MKALVKTEAGPGHLELKDWPEPKVLAGQVKLAIASCGICGTDIHILNGTWACQPPVVLGHEWCGTVVEVGPGVKHLAVGDRVVASNPAVTCGICFYCIAGNPFMCPDRISAGYMIDGAFAEFLCIDSRRCHKLPDNVSFREAALGEPLAVAVHSVIERTAVHAGDLVLVSGPGCIGLLTLQVAKLEGARVIISGLGKDQKRLDCARQLGADVVVDLAAQDLVEVVQQESKGRGADIVYECTGSAAALGACWAAVRKGGTLSPLGVYPGPIETDFNSIMMKELNVIGSYGYVWTSWQRTVQLLAEKRINVDAMISHEFSLEEYEQAFATTRDGSGIKVVINPGG
jgi:L-iditol 2-dehydrogenase